MKTIKDFKDYLDMIDDASKKLTPAKRDELDNILRVMLSGFASAG